MNNRTVFSLLLFSVSMLLSAISVAQESEADVVPEVTDSLVDYERTGWHPRLKFNGNFSLSQSSNVPGNQDGTSVHMGTALEATADYLGPKKNHEWTNALLWELGYATTPVVEDVWVKSVDRIDFTTAYLYHLPKVQWLGPFFKFRLTTAMFRAYDVRSDPTAYIRLDSDESITRDAADNPVTNAAGIPLDANGNPYDVIYKNSGNKIRLTDAFAPLTLRQTLGMFAKPLTKPQITFDSRLGVGAWESFVRDGYLLADVEGTDTIELKQMEDSVQLGVEASLALNGILRDDLLSYRFSVLFMQPFQDNVETEFEGIEKLNVELEAGIGLTITKYMSINYSFKAYRQPLITQSKNWQVQNNLLISIGFDLVGNPPPVVAQEEPPCDCADAVAAAVEEAQKSFEASKEEATAATVEPAPETASANPEASSPATETDDTDAADDSSEEMESAAVPAADDAGNAEN